MKTYCVMIDSHDRAKGYGIHVFPAGYSGPVPVRYYPEEGELTKALSKLKVVNVGILADLKADLKAGKDHVLATIPLSDEVVAEFGWHNG